MNTIIDALKWRYATQVFDQTKKLSANQLDTILESAILAPTSFGLQPVRFILVKNPEIRAKLREAGYNQPKITDASDLVVIAVPKVMNDATVDEFIQSISDVRGLSLESLRGYSDMIKSAVNGRTPEQRVEWATRQGYIALGVIIAACALEGVDAGPMEGFDPKQFDEILGLDAMGLESKVMIAIGFRSEEDTMAHAAKVRFPKGKMIIEI